jgi:hypothetical protein
MHQDELAPRGRSERHEGKRRKVGCPLGAWNIRAMYQDILGACEAAAPKGENFHQARKARACRKERGGPPEAELPKQSDRGIAPSGVIVLGL